MLGEMKGDGKREILMPRQRKESFPKELCREREGEREKRGGKKEEEEEQNRGGCHESRGGRNDRRRLYGGCGGMKGLKKEGAANHWVRM